MRSQQSRLGSLLRLAALLLSGRTCASLKELQA